MPSIFTLDDLIRWSNAVYAVLVGMTVVGLVVMWVVGKVRRRAGA